MSELETKEYKGVEYTILPFGTYADIKIYAPKGNSFVNGDTIYTTCATLDGADDKVQDIIDHELVLESFNEEFKPSRRELRDMFDQYRDDPTNIGTRKMAAELDKLPKGTMLSYKSDNSWHDCYNYYTKTDIDKYNWQYRYVVNGQEVTRKGMNSFDVASAFRCEVINDEDECAYTIMNLEYNAITESVNESVKKLTSNDIINIYNKLGYYYAGKKNEKRTIISVNKEAIPNMTELLEKNLRQSGKYGWYCAVPVMAVEQNRILEFLPIYGYTDHYETKWFQPTKEDAIKDDFKTLKSSSFNEATKNFEALGLDNAIIKMLIFGRPKYVLYKLKEGKLARLIINQENYYSEYEAKGLIISIGKSVKDKIAEFLKANNLKYEYLETTNKNESMCEDYNVGDKITINGKEGVIDSLFTLQPEDDLLGIWIKFDNEVEYYTMEELNKNKSVNEKKLTKYSAKIVAYKNKFDDETDIKQDVVYSLEDYFTGEEYEIESVTENDYRDYSKDELIEIKIIFKHEYNGLNNTHLKSAILGEGNCFGWSYDKFKFVEMKKLKDNVNESINETIETYKESDILDWVKKNQIKLGQGWDKLNKEGIAYYMAKLINGLDEDIINKIKAADFKDFDTQDFTWENREALEKPKVSPCNSKLTHVVCLYLNPETNKTYNEKPSEKTKLLNSIKRKMNKLYNHKTGSDRKGYYILKSNDDKIKIVKNLGKGQYEDIMSANSYEELNNLLADKLNSSITEGKEAANESCAFANTEKYNSPEEFKKAIEEYRKDSKYEVIDQTEGKDLLHVVYDVTEDKPKHVCTFNNTKMEKYSDMKESFMESVKRVFDEAEGIYNPSLILQAYNTQKEWIDSLNLGDELAPEVMLFIIEDKELKGTKLVKREDVYTYQPNDNEYYLDMVRDSGWVLTDYNLEPAQKLVDRWNDGKKWLNPEDKSNLIKEDLNDLHTIWKEQMKREPVIDTPDGPIYLQPSEDGKSIEYGTMTNTGMIVDGSVEYDFDYSLDANLDAVYDEITDTYGLNIVPEEDRDLVCTQEKEDRLNALFNESVSVENYIKMLKDGGYVNDRPGDRYLIEVKLNKEIIKSEEFDTLEKAAEEFLKLEQEEKEANVMLKQIQPDRQKLIDSTYIKVCSESIHISELNTRINEILGE